MFGGGIKLAWPPPPLTALERCEQLELKHWLAKIGEALKQIKTYAKTSLRLSSKKTVLVLRNYNGKTMSQSSANLTSEEPPSIVQCKVCGSTIDLDTKKEQHVVKCEYCNEATVSLSIQSFY